MGHEDFALVDPEKKCPPRSQSAINCGQYLAATSENNEPRDHMQISNNSSRNEGEGGGGASPARKRSVVGGAVRCHMHVLILCLPIYETFPLLPESCSRELSCALGAEEEGEEKVDPGKKSLN